MSKVRSPLLALVAACLFAAVPAFGRPRVDIVKLTNGDRVTCEIINLRSANLSVRTAAFGTVDIEWPDVAALISIQFFDVELVDGRHVMGRLDESEPAGGVDVVQSVAVRSTFALRDVASLVQLGATIWQSHRGHLDLGLNYASAERDMQFSFDAELALQGQRFRWTSSIAAMLSDNATSGQRARGVVQTSLEIPAGRSWLLVGTGKYEHNDDLDLEGRGTAIGEAVWIARRSAHGRWGLGAGAAENRERYYGQGGGESNTAAVLSVLGEYYRFGPFGTQASGVVNYLPILGGPSRHRVEINASFRQKLFRNFTFSLSPYYSYDSRPPQGVEQQESWGWVSSIGWTF